ncbi:MAG: glucose-6-phosphate isomerase [Burkholderiaceae bacterium]
MINSAWDVLERRAADSASLRIADLLAGEPDRFDRLSIEAAGLYIDLTRNPLAAADLSALLEHADLANLAARRDAMFAGERINTTEGRAVLHTLLRAPAGTVLMLDGQDQGALVHQTLDRLCAFADAVRSGAWRGADGRPLTDVINIGIGGSQLGPELAMQALAPLADGPRCHFLASLDPDAWSALAHSLDPKTTLVIVASKSWKTPETSQNAAAVREWLLASGIRPEQLARHCVGLTTNLAAAAEYGIPAENVFPFWDWVGGRYSLWSAIGLPVMLAIGPRAFRQMLAGAHEMDRHFATQPLGRNAPVLMALVSLWNALRHRSGSEAVVPYSSGLRRLPAYLQQLTMESNGKRVLLDGSDAPWPTAPVTWGEPGTESQHSFFQLLHQGTATIPVDFILVVPPADPHGRGISLMANCLAQADALMNGRDLDGARQALAAQGKAVDEIERLAPHLVYPGNRPTSTILLDRLDPARFGALIALYEHRTAALGWLWNINSFDQWGVEVGKQRAAFLQPLLERGPDAVPADRSTRELARRIQQAIAAR